MAKGREAERVESGEQRVKMQGEQKVVARELKAENIGKRQRASRIKAKSEGERQKNEVRK